MPGATFDAEQRITAEWPEVSVGTASGAPSLRVRRTSFCRVRSDRVHDRDDVHHTGALVVFRDVDEKPRLDAGYRAMLIRLADVEYDDLGDWLEVSSRNTAPATLVRRLDAAPGGRS